ncbi:hypothetical protein CEP51_012185 [Fusarium floridanum]|nr:hypothetical protein CEP51_012185 [Fusarium floridanum]
MSSAGSPPTGLSPRSRRSSSMDQSPPGQPPTNTIEVDSDLNDTDSAYPESEAATDGMSLRSSILNYKWENSRRYHAYKDGSYWAPNDEQQQDAEDLMHELYRVVLDGKLCEAPIGDYPQVSLPSRLSHPSLY